MATSRRDFLKKGTLVAFAAGVPASLAEKVAGRASLTPAGFGLTKAAFEAQLNTEILIGASRVAVKVLTAFWCIRSSLWGIPLHENVHPVLFGSIEAQPLEETQRRIEALHIYSQWFPGSRRLVEQFPNQVTSHARISLRGQKSNIYD